MQPLMRAEKNQDVIMGVCLDVNKVADKLVLTDALIIVPAHVLERAKASARTLVVQVVMEVVEVGNALYVGLKNYASAVV